MQIWQFLEFRMQNWTKNRVLECETCQFHMFHYPINMSAGPKKDQEESKRDLRRHSGSLCFSNDRVSSLWLEVVSRRWLVSHTAAPDTPLVGLHPSELSFPSVNLLFFLPASPTINVDEAQVGKCAACFFA